MTQSASPDEFHVHRTGHDPGETSRRLAKWLAAQVPAGAAPVVTLDPSAADSGGNGVSSETIPFHADWPAGPADYVLRTAPSPEDVPVFRGYHLDDQFRVMTLVGQLTSVPVPKARWLEPAGGVLGQPFFVMDAISGEVPPDMPPYNLGGNWLFDAGPNDQRRLQDASVAVLAQLHAIPGAEETFGFLLPRFPGSTPLRRHVAWVRDWYEFAAAGLARSPLAERVLDWLADNIPAEPEEPVLCWGDARIGNILYRDFTPAGVLDWEMATLGPRQLDLAWMIFAHRVFEHIARTYELPGMPDFLREEDVVGAYEERTGRQAGDLTWYYLDAAVQWSVIFMRTGTSQLHFKEIEMPDQVETLFYHRGLMEEMARAAGALS